MESVHRARRSVTTNLDELFVSSEENGRCLAADSPWVTSALSVRERCGYVLRIRRGLYVRSSYWAELNPVERHLHVARSLAHKHPGWVFCRMTAAMALGLSVTYGRHAFEEMPAEIALPSNTHCGMRGGVRMLPRGVGGAIGKASGLRVVSPVQAVYDCIRHLPFDESLALADSALRMNLLSTAELAALIENGRSARGIRSARFVLMHMDGRAESGGESMARARMIELGYQKPELQVEFPNPLEPGRTYRADMLVRCGERLVVLEFDGKSKYVDPGMLNNRTTLDVMLDERQREALLTSYGIEVMRLRYEDVMNEIRFRRLMEAYRIPRATT